MSQSFSIVHDDFWFMYSVPEWMYFGLLKPWICWIVSLTSFVGLSLHVRTGRVTFLFSLGCRVVAQRLLCQHWQPVGEQGESSLTKRQMSHCNVIMKCEKIYLKLCRWKMKFIFLKLKTISRLLSVGKRRFVQRTPQKDKNSWRGTSPVITDMGTLKKNKTAIMPVCRVSVHALFDFWHTKARH